VHYRRTEFLLREGLMIIIAGELQWRRRDPSWVRDASRSGHLGTGPPRLPALPAHGAGDLAATPPGRRARAAAERWPLPRSPTPES
jgi:hypothetical protein